ncbi:MAG: guanylate kinase [Ignavibacteria bacterium]|jgi:guanylate kinase|nr:guanylate kinase [Ignavibacteria bacterium]
MVFRKKGEIIIVAAPSGTGKTTILKQLLKIHNDLVYSVSTTTRKPRPTEKNGVDYFFVKEEEFSRKKEEGFFIEWEKVYDYYYGTDKSFVEGTINSGLSILIEVDVKGALSIKEKYPESKMIYILPPSLEELVKRLKNRKTETEEDFVKRIDRAKMELNQKDKFEYQIVNEDVNIAVNQLSELIKKIINKE